MKNAHYKVLEIHGIELPYSKKIDIVEAKDEYEIYIKNTTENMQEDTADFESIIISIWSVDRSKTIKLTFEKYVEEHDESARLHYMRFLYRVMRFRERYKDKGFILDDDDNVAEIDRFEKLYKDALENGKLWITKPQTQSGLKGYDKDSDTIISKEVTENHLEKWFVFQSQKKQLPEQMRKAFGNNRLYDQLPCGMFINEVSSSTRLFNAGYFDLWGVNDRNELCVFELKKENNKKLGIISELFFYAMVMKDMKKASKGKYSRIRVNHRGFKSFVENEKDEVINAFFLVPELHSFLENPERKKEFIKVLNEPNDGIKFGLITFDPKTIINDQFFSELVKDWKASCIKK